MSNSKWIYVLNWMATVGIRILFIMLAIYANVILLLYILPFTLSVYQHLSIELKDYCKDLYETP